MAEYRRELKVRPYVGNPTPTQEMIDDVRPFVELAEICMRERLCRFDSDSCLLDKDLD